jgi:hypothetical protein
LEKITAQTRSEEFAETWAHADSTPRVDAPRLKRNVDFVHEPPSNRPIPPEHPQHTHVNHIARYRAIRREKRNAAGTETY